MSGAVGLARLLRAQLASAVFAFSEMLLLDGARVGGTRSRQRVTETTEVTLAPRRAFLEEPATAQPPADLGAELRAARGEADIEALAVAARTEDPRAVDAFLRAIEGPVLRYCRTKLSVGSRHTAHDVAQDVLYAVCDALPHYQSGDGSVMAFVMRIARFKVVDAFRASGRDRSIPVGVVPDRPDPDGGPEVAAVLATEADRLRGALGHLAEHHREVVVLRIALGYSAEEVAQQLGTTAGAVRVTQHRALAKLRVLLADPVSEER